MAAFNWRAFGYQFVAYYFFYYALGFFLRKYKVEIGLKWGCFFALLWLAAACFWCMHEPPMFLKGLLPVPDIMLTTAYRYFTALLAIVALMGIAPTLLERPSSKVVERLKHFGQVSLGIYVIHLFIGGWCNKMWETLGLDSVSVAYVMCDFCFRLAVSLVAIWLLMKWKWTAFLLLGKEMKK